MQILKDIKTAVELTGEIRKSREEGYIIKPHMAWRVPVHNISRWVWTMEACILVGHEAESAVIAVFSSFDEKTQLALTFAPKEPGGLAERARFWQRELKPVLPPRMYHKVVLLLLSRYSNCLRRSPNMNPSGCFIEND